MIYLTGRHLLIFFNQILIYPMSEAMDIGSNVVNEIFTVRDFLVMGENSRR